MQDQHQQQGAAAPVDLSSQGDAAVAAIAGRHHVSPQAVAVLVAAIARGHGRQAQFSHPDLGGMGQWSRGGMLMIGDMFNHDLKAKVAALCEEVADLLEKDSGGKDQSLFAEPSAASDSAGTSQWPGELGQPSSTGSQNDMRYAVFPDTHRLAIAHGDAITVYDTGDHRITGLGQQQGSAGSLTLTSQHGAVRLDDLPVVSGADTPQDPAGSSDDTASPPPAGDHDAIFAKIEGLGGLHAKGLLSDDEYQTKKQELLARL
jgi:hypothetical protein